MNRCQQVFIKPREDKSVLAEQVTESMQAPSCLSACLAAEGGVVMRQSLPSPRDIQVCVCLLPFPSFLFPQFCPRPLTTEHLPTHTASPPLSLLPPPPVVAHV